MSRTNGADGRAQTGREVDSLSTAHATVDALEAKLTAATDALVRVSDAVDAIARLVERELDGGDPGPERWRHRARPPAL